MAVVLALILTTLCGIHSASIPTSTDTTMEMEPRLDGKLNSMLDGVLESRMEDGLDGSQEEHSDKVRRSVMDGMRKLMDNQLAAFLESKGTGKKGIIKKRLKPKYPPHQSINPRTVLQESTNFDEIKSTEIIGALTDATFQDAGDDTVRYAVDQLIREKIDETKENDDAGEDFSSTNGNQINGDIIIQDNNQDIVSENVNNTDVLDTHGQKEKQNDMIHKPHISHIIIEHVPKLNEVDGSENFDSISESDDIQSTLKSASGSPSQETETKFKPYLSSESNKENESHVSNIFQNYDNNIKINGANDIDTDENTLEAEHVQIIHEVENSPKPQPKTHLKPNYESNTSKDHHKGSIKHKPHRRVYKNDHSKKHAYYRNHSKKLQKHANKHENGIVLRIEHENEEHHNGKQPNHKTHNNHHNKNHHNKNSDKHKHDKNHYHAKEDNQPIIVRLISGSDESNDSQFHGIRDHNKPYKSTFYSRSNKGHVKNKKRNSNHYDSITSRESPISEESVSRDSKSSAEDEDHLTKINQSNSPEESGDSNSYLTNESKHSPEDEYKLHSKENSNTELSHKADYVKQSSGNAKSEENLSDDNDDMTNEIKTWHKKENSDEETSTQDKIHISGLENSVEEKECHAAEAKYSKDINKQKCHQQRKNRKDKRIGPNVIRDLIQNKDMKKAYSLSLTLSAKETK